jgi:mRNA interferase HigB
MVRIANADALVKAARRYRDAAEALRVWVKVVQDARWKNIADVRLVYPSADGVTVGSGAVITVFNVRGNRYRLLTYLTYRAELVTVIELLTHADYNKEKWKDRL